MAEEIVRLAAAEYADAMDFLNLVYSSAYRPHDFATMLPAVYRPTEAHMANNYALRRDGRIRAIVGMFPLEWELGGTRLRVAGIGGVSTHPADRKRGYMRRLMEHCLGEMRRQGYALSWLGGQRQRYLRYGYETCGYSLSFAFRKAGATACPQKGPHMTFRPFPCEDETALAQARRLHQASPARARRAAEDFALHLRAWHNVPYLAADDTGRTAGYLVTNPAGDSVAELAAEDPGTALAMLRDWTLGRAGDGISVQVPPLERDWMRLLGRYAEHVQVSGSGNWQVFDWVRVLDALLKAQAAAGPLPHGAVTIQVEGVARVRLEVSDQFVGCRPAEAPADVCAEAPAVLRLLFGPLRPSAVLALPASAAVLESWCPLPVRWPPQDGV